MKKILKILLTGAIFSVVVFFAMLPTQFQFSSSVVVGNHKGVVFEKIANVNSLKKLLQFKGIALDSSVSYSSTQKKGKGAFVKCDEDQESRFLQIVECVQDSLVALDVDFSDDDYGNRLLFTLDSLKPNKTLFTYYYTSRKLLNPFRRLVCLWERDVLQKDLQSYVQYVKMLAESEFVRKVVLSGVRSVFVEDTLLCFRQESRIHELAYKKKVMLDSMLRIDERFDCALAKDTLRGSLVRYTKWKENKVEFEVCVPSHFFKEGKVVPQWIGADDVEVISQKYFSSFFVGREQDLSWGWDSLYQLAAQRGVSLNDGFPLERLVRDSISDNGYKKWRLYIPID